MYIYSEVDQKLIEERAAQFQDQTTRYLANELADEEFQQLRLRNGLYLQKLAPMLRVAVPYGLLSSNQLRKLAEIARDFDKGYAHLTTRQNIQFNWPSLEDVPRLLSELAKVQMHAIQTSGSCIRNVTSDQYAGVARDEIEDPRPWAELIRQWSSFHPEFNWLPRKFKIAITGALDDRAAVSVHDIGLRLVQQDRETGFQVTVGGGLGRTPVIGSVIRQFLPKQHLLTYLEAILRVYNQFGRRDNKYKARIKILVRAMKPEVFAERVETEWQHLCTDQAEVNLNHIETIRSRFTHSQYKTPDEKNSNDISLIADSSGFHQWVAQNTLAHKQPGYAIVNLSLKETGVAPGDITEKQMDFIADIADRYSQSEVRVTHEQNLTLADVEEKDLFPLWQALGKKGLSTPNIGLLTDIICCPGGDYCSLANAKSIPVAEAIQRKFSDQDQIERLGKIDLNISGCMNACAHHHVGNIGILGVDKKGAEYYQVSLGGSSANNTSLGQILGPSFARDQIPEVIEKIISVFELMQKTDESFLDTFRRIGIQPYKNAVYEL